MPGFEGANIIIPQPSPIPASIAWGLPNTQSAFSNVTNSQPVAPYGTPGDTPGCFYDRPNLVTLLPGAAYNIPYGRGQILTGGAVNSCVVQIFQSNSWIVIHSLDANDAWFYESDFTNKRLLNGVSGTTILTLLPRRTR